MSAPRRPWTEHEVAMLRAHYADWITADLARAIGRPIGHVFSKAQKLGLRKGEAFLASSASGRILKGGKLGQAHQFQPGMTPWNKGLHYQAGGRAAESQFQPGSKPHTWRPVGSLRINADGYLQRKITDTGYAPRDWQSAHTLAWVEAHGPVPAGHVVVFKPGRRTTDPAAITADAVELVTRRELMARNTVHNLPRPLAEIAQLRGAIKRQINQRTPKDPA